MLSFLLSQAWRSCSHMELRKKMGQSALGSLLKSSEPPKLGIETPPFLS